jgi:hypothetical protein
MKRSDISFLKQLIDSFEEAEIKLEKAYKEENFTEVNRSKRIMLQIQEKISEILK